jgi:hypothetical protein
VLDILLRVHEEDMLLGAMLLAGYGDPAALPALHQAFARYRVTDTDSPLASQTLIELRGAIECLGGTLTPAEQAKLRLVDVHGGAGPSSSSGRSRGSRRLPASPAATIPVPAAAARSTRSATC